MNAGISGIAGYYDEQTCDVLAFRACVEKNTNACDVPNASAIEKNVPIYDANDIGTRFEDDRQCRVLMSEWASILKFGAGVYVVQNAQPDHESIDGATAEYERIIAEEKTAGGSGADHFASAGKNDRIWNALEKLCLGAPDIFASYFASPAIDVSARAWLGPNYQMTAQINLVHPGGKAQQVHRDYHLGFQSAAVCAEYPAHVHDLSPLMTLQGGLAHCDIPVQSGPTKLLPFSQTYGPGYSAWRRPDFVEYFEESYVQLPLGKGDAIFFNPALFHAAGENRSTDIHRMVNLFQVSSAFGRAMELVDRAAMCRAVYPAVLAASNAGRLSRNALRAVIGAVAEGYSFPANLDLDPPEGGLAPITQAAIFARSIANQGTAADFEAELAVLESRKLPGGGAGSKQTCDQE